MEGNVRQENYEEQGKGGRIRKEKDGKEEKGKKWKE